MSSVNPAAIAPGRQPGSAVLAARPEALARLQVGWLTMCALIAASLVTAVGPGDRIANAVFASTFAEFGAAAAPGRSIELLNGVRAGLAADLLLLVAYGLLLRQSIRLHDHPWCGAMRWCAVAIMIADAVENVSALSIVPRIAWEQGEPSPAVFLTMNAAAVIKWLLAGIVLLFLATRWLRRAGTERPSLRWVGRAAALLFAVGGAASLAVAASPLLPDGIGGPFAKAAILASAFALLLQFRLLDVSGVLVRLLFLVRLPAGVLMATAAFGPFALGPAAPLLGGILDVPSSWGVSAITAAALVLAFACATQINVVRAHAWQRMFDRTLRIFRPRAWAPTVFWTTTVVAASFVCCVAVAAADVSVAVPGAEFSIVRMIGNVLRGMVIALIFVFVVEVVAAIFSEPGLARRRPQLAVPIDRPPWLGPWLRRIRATAPPAFVAALKATAGRWWPVRLFGLQSGYVDGQHRLLPGHSFALVQLAISLAFYAVLIYSKWHTVASKDPWVPTAAAVLLLLLLVGWLLAGATFFLDRYRLPLVTAVVALALVGSAMKGTDHVVTLSPAGRYPLPTPGQVLRKFGDRPIIVAAAGGGIQAGAWAARVLQGIDDALGTAPDRTLRDRLALVTGVSGGAMGAMFYEAYRDTDPALGSRQSQEPSLDEVASALIGPDLLRIFGASPADRGAALERSWASRLPASHRDAFTLRAWTERVHRFASGETSAPFPAFLFESTIVETGQAMAFATTQFPSQAYRNSFQAQAKQSPLAESANLVFDLADGRETEAGDVGLTVATAARLSAAFPYVSPAATLRSASGRPLHLVDGGYYDNYGLVITSQWLDDALMEIVGSGRAERAIDIDLAVVRSLVDSTDQLVVAYGTENDRRLRYTKDAQRHGWPWQAVAPPLAFINGRTFGQWAGGNQVLRLLIDKWWPRDVRIHVHLFDLPARSLTPGCRVEPLSWKLTAAQKLCIERGWRIVSPQAGELDSKSVDAVMSAAGRQRAPVAAFADAVRP